MSVHHVSPFPVELENKVIHGDFFDVWKSVPDNSIDLIISSPPYYNAKKEYASWETYEDYQNWLNLVFKELARTLRPGRRMVWNVCDYASDISNGAGVAWSVPISADSINSAREAGLKLRHHIIWEDPSSAGRFHPTGSFPHAPSVIVKHTIEFVIVFVKPKSQSKSPNPNGVNIDILPEDEMYDEMGHSFFKRYVSNQIWSIPRQTTDRDLHPAPFPEALVEPCIRMWSRPGEVVADPFSGSATSAINAMLWHRKYFGTERDKKYWEYSQKRIADRELLIATNQFVLPMLDMLKSDMYTPNEIRIKQSTLIK